MSSSIFFILSILVIVHGHYINVNDDGCDTNEEYSHCGLQCQRTCEDVGQLEKLCSHQCISGCFCIDGYVRKNDNNRECVKESEC